MRHRIEQMSETQKYGGVFHIFTVTVLLITCFASGAHATDDSYSPRSADELEVISLAMASEVQANNWTKSEVICFSVEGKDPDTMLVKTLRQRGLNVRKLSEWRKNFACGFHVNLRFVSTDSRQTIRLHAEVADVRGINSGDGHFAIRIRDGEYSLSKSEGKWSIRKYVSSK
jgi:hypothetical protein